MLGPREHNLALDLLKVLKGLVYGKSFGLLDKNDVKIESGQILGFRLSSSFSSQQYL